MFKPFQIGRTGDLWRKKDNAYSYASEKELLDANLPRTPTYEFKIHEKEKPPIDAQLCVVYAKTEGEKLVIYAHSVEDQSLWCKVAELTAVSCYEQTSTKLARYGDGTLWEAFIAAAPDYEDASMDIYLQNIAAQGVSVTAEGFDDGIWAMPFMTTKGTFYEERIAWVDPQWSTLILDCEINPFRIESECLFTVRKTGTSQRIVRRFFRSVWSIVWNPGGVPETYYRDQAKQVTTLDPAEPIDTHAMYEMPITAEETAITTSYTPVSNSVDFQKSKSNLKPWGKFTEVDWNTDEPNGKDSWRIRKLGFKIGYLSATSRGARGGILICSNYPEHNEVFPPKVYTPMWNNEEIPCRVMPDEELDAMRPIYVEKTLTGLALINSSYNLALTTSQYGDGSDVFDETAVEGLTMGPSADHPQFDWNAQPQMADMFGIADETFSRISRQCKIYWDKEKAIEDGSLEQETINLIDTIFGSSSSLEYTMGQDSWNWSSGEFIPLFLAFI